MPVDLEDMNRKLHSALNHLELIKTEIENLRIDKDAIRFNLSEAERKIRNVRREIREAR